jgi:Putative transcriptional regulator
MGKMYNLITLAAAMPAGGAGQLDREIQEESWWLGPLDELLLLDLDYELRWERTMDNLGFDPLTTTFSQTGMV